MALHGDRDDGHAYLREAEKNGAAILLCEETYAYQGGCTVEVKSTEEALARLAAAVRARINPTVIAITGSVGKTTTKEMIAAILDAKDRLNKNS